MTVMDFTTAGSPAHFGQRRLAKPNSTFSLRGRVIVGTIFAFALLGGVGGWSATAKLSGALISAGTVLIDQHVKVIQHLDGGVVEDIAVHEGDHVTAGQILLRLDDVQIQAEKAIIVGQLGELSARVARLRAERDGEAAIGFGADFLVRFPNSAAIMQGEQQLFDSNMRKRNSQKEQLRLQVTQLNEEVGGLEMQAKALDDEMELTRSERTRMDTLGQKGLIETSRVNSADREIARMVGSEGELKASIARTKAHISEIELQVLSIDEVAYNDAQREIRTVEAQIAELDERRAAAAARLDRTEIRSPVDGIINELAVTTVGGVITPAEKLLTVVPSDADFKIQFRVAPKDIDQIEVGQTAKLRFTSFNQRTTPEIDGKVTRISAAATSDAKNEQSFYLAEADITGDISPLGRTGLVPGMPVEVFVRTHEQVAIAYFLKPFTDQVTRAFREE